MDWDDGGTELVEAYGELTYFCLTDGQTICSSSSSSVGCDEPNQELTSGEAGTGKSCLLYQCIHERCKLLGGDSS